MHASPSPLGPPMNHVFIDFENVQQVDLGLIGAAGVNFTLLIGPQQAKLEVGLVEKLLEHASSVRLVKLKSKAKNAVDFALAYYLGRAAVEDPTGCFHIIAKDGGYDPLIQHLRERHIRVQRHASCAELTFSWPGKKVVASPAKPKSALPGAKVNTAVKSPQAGAPVDLVAKALAYFRKNVRNRPKKRKSLLSQLKSLLGNQAKEAEAEKVLSELRQLGLVAIGEDDVVTYQV